MAILSSYFMRLLRISIASQVEYRLCMLRQQPTENKESSGIARAKTCPVMSHYRTQGTQCSETAPKGSRHLSKSSKYPSACTDLPVTCSSSSISGHFRLALRSCSGLRICKAVILRSGVERSACVSEWQAMVSSMKTIGGIPRTSSSKLTSLYCSTASLAR